MPWKASSVMEERLRFVARLLDGEPMTGLCREFGISRPRAPCRSIRRIILCASHGALFSISRPLPHRGYRLVREI
jgi:hypothetical protein